MAPGKYILILFEKSGESQVDRQTGEGTNLDSSIRLGVVKKYLFKPFNRLCHRSVFLYVHGMEVVIHLHHS